ncbi:hypothetical protein F5883DRAFT_581492, partial [Diaporthe sp. PMI_573]
MAPVMAPDMAPDMAADMAPDMAADLALAVPIPVVPIPDFPDDFTCLTAFETADERELKMWDRAMFNSGKHINFFLLADKTPPNEALCPVQVRVPKYYNSMTDQDERVGRLWLEHREATLSGNTVAFPIPTIDERRSEYSDFIFTNIAVHASPGTYRFYFQLMVRDRTAPGGWTMRARMRSTEFEVDRYISYDYVLAQDAWNIYAKRFARNTVNIDPTIGR